jgi:hypothetical protein
MDWLVLGQTKEVPAMDVINGLVNDLKKEAADIQSLGRALLPAEVARVKAIGEAVPLLENANALLDAEVPNNLITYKIANDVGGKLKRGARIACNFWNRFIVPCDNIVMRLGTFTAQNNTIARSYQPYSGDGVLYGRIEFNTKFLDQFTDNQIAGTVVHELGHTIGYGWDEWTPLFNEGTGKFTDKAITDLVSLKEMLVELDGGGGTALSHWDEETFGGELMTGYKDPVEHVLPVTIDVCRLLGHVVAERLTEKTDLTALLDEASQVEFTRHGQAKALDLDYFQETDIFEELPHHA